MLGERVLLTVLQTLHPPQKHLGPNKHRMDLVEIISARTELGWEDVGLAKR